MVTVVPEMLARTLKFAPPPCTCGSLSCACVIPADTEFTVMTSAIPSARPIAITGAAFLRRLGSRLRQVPNIPFLERFSAPAVGAATSWGGTFEQPWVKDVQGPGIARKRS
ncbi:hypothetical protein GQF42_14400 [Streptomyces broussonetiae]|uniref:Uncharacterized protein n=1 Tax=Streptomyces broussonetiae TaxID=2686304 RepID=A0A6I6N2T7_9ACTN|nr:hypothetical protein [Streptomyces broussonetiae]QHA04320.1 hypothetical protein GQF42_14400 [Streptomyces broussonetiae]